MKLTILISALLFGNAAISQTIPFQDVRFNIYDNVNGIQSLLPSKTIIYNNNNISVYERNNGLMDLFPKTLFEATPVGGYNVYDLQNGMRSILPTQTIMPVNNININNNNMIYRNSGAFQHPSTITIPEIKNIFFPSDY